MRQNQCSPSARMGVHDQPEYAAANMRLLRNQMCFAILFLRELLRCLTTSVFTDEFAIRCDAYASLSERQFELKA